MELKGALLAAVPSHGGWGVGWGTTLLGLDHYLTCSRPIVPRFLIQDTDLACIPSWLISQRAPLTPKPKVPASIRHQKCLCVCLFFQWTTTPIIPTVHERNRLRASTAPGFASDLLHKAPKLKCDAHQDNHKRCQRPNTPSSPAD